MKSLITEWTISLVEMGADVTARLVTVAGCRMVVERELANLRKIGAIIFGRCCGIHHSLEKEVLIYDIYQLRLNSLRRRTPHGRTTNQGSIELALVASGQARLEADQEHLIIGGGTVLVTMNKNSLGR